MLSPTALGPFLRMALDEIYPQWKKDKKRLNQRITEEAATAIAESHVATVNWAKEVHPLLPGGETSDSIELSFRSIPRSLGMRGEQQDETDLLVAERHVMVLGDPGAGKTTTLRRLANLVSLGGPLGDEDAFRFVVVIVCRQEDWSGRDPLMEILARRVGITGKLAADLDNPERVVRDILNEGALILIDGLDELPTAHQDRVWNAIQVTSSWLSSAKIIASCRSGAYVAHLEGFDRAEIEPLTPEQISEAVQKVLGADADAFFEAIGANPASGLANRPLFLINMVRVFRARGSIPNRPAELYESIVDLVLRKWDEDRRVRRTSAYSNFSVDDKQRFLADIALDFIQRARIQFDTPALVDAYKRIAPRYELPLTAAREVAREIESHTGLIVQAAPDQYEFSHLSLHEYLAANALVRGGRSGDTLLTIETVPEVAAVAIALASNANALLSGFVDDVRANRTNLDVPNIHRFLYRLGQERPRFDPTAEVGDDLIYLLVKGSPSGFQMDAQIGKQLGSTPTARKSVNLALERIRLSVGSGNSIGVHREVPGAPLTAGRVHKDVLAALVGEQRVDELLRRTPGR